MSKTFLNLGFVVGSYGGSKLRVFGGGACSFCSVDLMKAK